jgi:hypothetical protein
MLLCGPALSARIDTASGVEVLAYFESNASSVGKMFLQPVETFFSGETTLRLGDSREDQRRDTLGHD